jgi:hypothetical protein
MTPAVMLVAALLALCPTQAVPCLAVRKAVAQYGETAVESWARSKGISEKEREGAAMPQVTF